MGSNGSARPKIVDEAEWRRALDEQIAREKAHMRAGDEVAAARRRLPMVRVKSNYAFDGELGPETLLDLFEGCSQLIVYHFMFHPDWEEGCKSCSFWSDNYDRSVAHLGARDTSLVAVSRAPLEKLLEYRRRLGWSFPWYSSSESDFNRSPSSPGPNTCSNSIALTRLAGEALRLVISAVRPSRQAASPNSSRVSRASCRL